MPLSELIVFEAGGSVFVSADKDGILLTTRGKDNAVSASEARELLDALTKALELLEDEEE